MPGKPKCWKSGCDAVTRAAIHGKLSPGFQSMLDKGDHGLNYPSMEMKVGIDSGALETFADWPLQPLLELDTRGGHFSQLDVEDVFKKLCNRDAPTKLAVARIVGKMNLGSCEKAARDWAYIARVMCSHTCIRAKDFRKRQALGAAIPDSEHPPKLRQLYSQISPEFLADSSNGSQAPAIMDTTETKKEKPMPLPYFNNDNQEEVIAEMNASDLLGDLRDSDSDAEPTDDDDTVEVARIVENGKAIRILSNGRKEEAVLVTHGEGGQIVGSLHEI